MSDLQTILERVSYTGNKQLDYELWACRGTGRGCSRNKYRNARKHCTDCFGPLPNDWTLQQVIDHLARGDA